jgi:DNA polymerase-4
MSEAGPNPGICRDCAIRIPDRAVRCPACGSRRLFRHAELHSLTIAHIDCDAFYASIEKRDAPELADRPVIVGGGRRGVVSACCYIARLYGVHSAMPMFQALAACPNAVVIPPDMKKYRIVGRQVRALMQELTPLVQPLSIDEAFLDLTGTERLHGGSPAQTLARLVRRLETGIGITASFGLSYNKFLAKVASDLDKPRGLSAIGRVEAQAFLDRQSVDLIWGVGKTLRQKLEADGIRTIAELRQHDEFDLMKRYGVIGRQLARFARGEDTRRVDPGEPAKSVSAETTFDSDLADPESLRRRLWPLCETVARRLKAEGVAGRSVVLKLKTADFRQLTRSRRLDAPTQLADRLFNSALPLLDREATGARFRLIGIGCTDLTDAVHQSDPPDLLDPGRNRRAQVEKAIDAVRVRLGDGAIVKGRAFDGTPARHRRTDEPVD